MPVDGCQSTFAKLDRTVLPHYLADLHEPTPMAEFGKKGSGPRTLAKLHGFRGDIEGCYVLYDAGRPIYVGISRHVFERLLEHVRPGDHFTATLAYRMARCCYPFDGTAAEAMSDPPFRAEFDHQREYLLTLHVAVVEITDPLERYLFEAYCAMELNTGLDNGGWNTFNTH